jgi:hypothetical protein
LVFRDGNGTMLGRWGGTSSDVFGGFVKILTRRCLDSEQRLEKNGGFSTFLAGFTAKKIW